MTHDLLKLADECESIATYPDVDTQIYELVTNGAEMLARSTVALREAHAEIERKYRQLEKSEREYLDIRTELEKSNDKAEFNIQKRLDTLDAWIKAEAELSRIRSELDAANSLVKRHEAALEFVALNDDDWSPWEKGNGKVVMIHCGETMVYLGEHDTPLAAIEAAMKEAE